MAMLNNQRVTDLTHETWGNEHRPTDEKIAFQPVHMWE